MRWSNKSAQPVAQIDSLATSYPRLDYPAIWAATSGDSFYSYNGEWDGSGFNGKWDGSSFNDSFGPSVSDLTENTLLYGSLNNNSLLVSWSVAPPRGDSNFTDLRRVSRALYASGGGWGFALGGVQNNNTEVNRTSVQPVPGLVMFNTTTQEWLNVSTTGYSMSGNSSDGCAHFVPSFGAAGLLFAMGGWNDGNMPTMEYISYLDIASQQWFSQATSGDKPPSVRNACVIGRPGDNNTHEVRLLFRSLTRLRV